MTPERWKRIERIFHAARRRDPGDRAPFLDQLCSTDDVLRREVESLLAAAEGGSGALGRPAVEAAAQALAMNPGKLSAGEHLGPYELVARIGAGGMGEVWRARDPAIRRDVAVKVLLPVYSSDPERRRRFEREARAAGMLNHPNVVSIHAVGDEGGRPYLVTELLEGESLRQRLERGPLAPARAVDCAIQTARGLAAAHHRGLVHRDLKPENIFLTRDDGVKVLDFGLAKLVQPDSTQDQTLRTAAGIVMGTPGYMSPEQIRGEAADHRSDIFAFGAILFEMLTGCPAFSGATAVEAMAAALKQDPPEPAGAPPVLRRIVRRCLEKNPGDRFQSARDLAFHLESALEFSKTQTKTQPDKPVSAPDLPPMDTPRRRVPPVVWFVLLGVVGAVGGHFVARSVGRNAAPQAAPVSAPAPVEERPVAAAPASPAQTAPSATPRTPIRIVTEPSGAGLRIDGRPADCVTPCVLETTPGLHSILVVRSGFRDLRREVRVSQGMRELPPFILTPTGGVLMLQSQPSGATILLNGERQLQVTPAQLSLRPGDYQITLERDQLKGSQTVTLTDGDFRHLSIPLFP